MSTQKQTRRRRPRFFYRHPGPVDAPLVLNVLTLVVFGLVMLFSASYAMAYYYYGDSYKFIGPQFIYAIAGVGIMFVVSLVDYHWLRGWAYPLYGFTLILLVVVLIPGIGVELNGCRRWLNLGLGTVQPSEVAKFAIILLMAHLLTLHQKHLKDLFYCVVTPVVLLIPIVGLLFLEPHNSAIVLMAGLLVIMMWCGGVALRWFLVGGGGVLALGATYMVYLMYASEGYAGSRLQHWIASFTDLEQAADQTVQSVYSIGNGGLFGVGIGNSNQKQLWLSEPQNDFIFAILCEELGFVGALACILLFAALVFQGVRVAMRAPDRFGGLLAVGVTAHIAMQTVLNIAVTTNLIPNTGISLPFFSAGGTSLVMLLGEVGVLMSVCRAGNAARRDAEASDPQQGGGHGAAPGSLDGRTDPAPQLGGEWKYYG